MRTLTMNFNPANSEAEMTEFLSERTRHRPCKTGRSDWNISTYYPKPPSVFANARIHVTGSFALFLYHLIELGNYAELNAFNLLMNTFSFERDPPFISTS